MTRIPMGSTERKSLVITKIFDFRTTSLAGPRPYEGDKREFFPGMSPVPSECILDPTGVDRPNPMVGFLRVYAEEEVNSNQQSLSSRPGGLKLALASCDTDTASSLTTWSRLL